MTTGPASDDPATAWLRRLLARRGEARAGAVPEAPVDEEAYLALPGAEEIPGRLEAALVSALDRLPPDEVGDPGEYRHALSLLVDRTARVTRRLGADPRTPLDPVDVAVLEAVVHADGSRPTLLVRDDAVDPDHPLAGEWHDLLVDSRARLSTVVRAVGRVEPAAGQATGFFGTAWVVDADAGLVLTNRHVVLDVRRRLSHRVERVGEVLRIVGDALFVDLAAESARTRRRRFRVVEAVVPPAAGTGLARLDAAVLRVDPDGVDGDRLPPGIVVRADLDGVTGALGSHCVVGCPGPPPYRGGVQEGVDWTWVQRTLFGGRFGVKRLAPGVTHRPLGSFPGDHDPPWVFGHDATTLGGSSGSAVIAWTDDDPTAFGLHFAGATLDTNVAHAVGACADELRALGVPVVP